MCTYVAFSYAFMLPGGRRGCGKKEMEFMWMSHLAQFWGADYENLCYTANFRGLQPRFHENASFSAKNVKSFKFKNLFNLPTINQWKTSVTCLTISFMTRNQISKLPVT